MFLFVSLILSFSAPSNSFAATTVNSTDALIAALANPAVANIEVSGQFLIPFDSPNAVNITSIEIPAGKKVTFLDTSAYYLQINCEIRNYGTIINYFNKLQTNNIFMNYGSFVNNAVFFNSGAITNSGSIYNAGTMINNVYSTINNNGAFVNSGIWTNNGTYNGAPVVLDNPIELIYNGVSTAYVTFQDALAQINNTGYELRVLKDITIDGNINLPIVGFTLSGAKPDGGTSTLTVNNGNFNSTATVVLKDIRLAHTGTTGGNFNTTYYQPLTIQTGVTFSDINIVGTAGSFLNVQGNVDLGNNSILNISTINISNGGMLKVKSLQTNSLNLSNGSTLDITYTGGLTVTGALNSSGSDNNLLLPAPSDHAGTVYSAMLTNVSIGGTSAIKLYPTAGVTFSNRSRLIYLNNTSVAENKFVAGDPKFAVVNKTLDGKQYLTVIRSTSTALSCVEGPVTYGIASFTLTAAVKDGNNAALTSGTVNFYQGESTSGSLMATVNVDSGGIAQCAVIKDYAVVGDNLYSAVYQDTSETYNESAGTVTVHMNPKSLSISGVTVKDKEYDGTTIAEITGINFSGVVGEDVVTAIATAAFKDATAGVDKAVDLFDITLSGVDAGKYTIASMAADITTATITPAVSIVQLSASPEISSEYGSMVSLTASVTGIGGTTPSGTIIFYSGSNELGTVPCTGGRAVYQWDNVPVGIYDLTAVYSGDANHSEAIGTIAGYTVTKKDQAVLIADGLPADVHYGDSSFILTALGGSGDGEISFAVKSGASVQVDAVRGEVTIVGTGETIITVTKAGTEIYEPIRTEVTVNVAAKSLSISGVTVKDKEYDGTAAAEVTEISLSGIVGGDVVTASATATFKDAVVGVDKAVDLSDITLSGNDAGKYSIAQTAADITKAIITPAVPIVQLSASPMTSAVYGSTVSLTASITGIASGTTPSGSVTFYCGSNKLGTVPFTGGEVVYEWNNVPLGSYSLSVVYSGDANYSEATGTIAGYTVIKKEKKQKIK